LKCRYRIDIETGKNDAAWVTMGDDRVTMVIVTPKPAFTAIRTPFLGVSEMG
jgi:hypothetical protein